MSKKPTFNELAELYMLSMGHLEKGTRLKYKQNLERFWLPVLGECVISDIKAADLLRVVAGIEWTSPKARLNALIPLRGVFSLAFYDGLIGVNITERIKSKKLQAPEPDPFSQDDVDRILSYMKQCYHPWVFNYFKFGFYSGLRIEEIIALRWADVEWSGIQGMPFVFVRRARVYGEVKGTKTGRSRRVNLTEPAIQALLAQRGACVRPDAFVFQNPFTMEPWCDNGKAQRIRYWKPTLEALNIRHRPPKVMRHSYATMLLMSGVNPSYAASQMGHSVQVFFNVYARWLGESHLHKSEHERLGRFIGERAV